jgi:hypothetical protein
MTKSVLSVVFCVSAAVAMRAQVTNPYLQLMTKAEDHAKAHGAGMPVLSPVDGTVLSGEVPLSVNGPWALRRDRPPSVPEIQNGTKNGDAFFADYTVIVGLSHHF